MQELSRIAFGILVLHGLGVLVELGLQRPSRGKIVIMQLSCPNGANQDYGCLGVT